MSRALCELQAQLYSVNHNDGLVAQDGRQLTIAEFFRKRKRESRNDFSEKTLKTTCTSKANTPTGNKSKLEGNFPTSKELASLSENMLRSRCNVGYRAKYIIGVAEMVEKGRLKLEEIENEVFDITLSKKVIQKLQKLKGIGQFASKNIVMCLGDYRHIPIDSETINHLCLVHGKKKGKEGSARKDVKEVYDKYAPYQCLAYWFEHCEFYEKQLDEEMSKLSPSSYHKVSSSYLSKNTPQN
ncbi:uncharacterized protein LOC141652384 [Silene latifolia]|uniref:uncharacterized protein LOC141652384 n=1 Tax=Silene latifolia TaxID=37657 RepID=UPI003D785093